MSNQIIKVIESHTGSVLISGAVSLKVGALISSWPLLLGGYGALIGVGIVYIKKWRDQ